MNFFSDSDLNQIEFKQNKCIKEIIEDKVFEINKIEKKKVEINLEDCLACGGCLVDDEKKEIERQKIEEINSAYQQGKSIVCSISSQSRAVFSDRWEISGRELNERLINMIEKAFGAIYVVGDGVGEKIFNLVEEELIQKGRNVSCICPGWAMYMKRRHPEILTRVIGVKSAMNITGTILKQLCARVHEIDLIDVFCFAIMPCYDRKIEGRIFDDETDVDCVVTTDELWHYFESRTEILNEKLKKPIDCYFPYGWPIPDISWNRSPGSVSGGYAQTRIFSTKKSLIFSNPLLYKSENFEIRHVSGRNSDSYMLVLTYNNAPIYSAAVVNGFRNIPAVVHALTKNSVKSSSSFDYLKCDYIEIMACSHGCINGNGQFSLKKNNGKPLITSLIDSYNRIEITDINEDKYLHDRLYNWFKKFLNEYHLTFEIPLNNLPESKKKIAFSKIDW